MKNLSDKSINVYSGPISSDKLNKHETNVFEECYCPNGHNLLSKDVLFFDFPAIKIQIRHKKDLAILYISPVIGDKCKVSFDTRLKTELLYELLCPECSVMLPAFSPCSCGGNLVAVFLDKGLKLSNCVTLCNRFGCPHSEVMGLNKLRSIHL